MFPVDGAFITAVSPRFTGEKAGAQGRIIAAIAPVFAATLEAFAIDTRLRIAHFMGQVCHECAGFRTTEEFASGAAYEGRRDLGNDRPGDGQRFKGRGLIQLTGRANYRTFGERLGLPLEAEPARAADPATALTIACEYWRARRINRPADGDDLVAVTRLVNGGTNGLSARGAFVRKAKALLADMEAARVERADAPPPLRRGSRGEAVGALQARLRNRGYGVAIDRDFGPATELAVSLFQRRSGLVADGVVGRATRAALGG